MVNNLAGDLAEFNNFGFRSYFLLTLLVICRKGIALTKASNVIDSLVQSGEAANTIKIIGDKMDCVAILEQAAFKNPLLRDHKIQMKSRTNANVWKHVKPENNTLFSSQNKDICPIGKIPIQQHTKDGYFGIKNVPTNERGNSKYATYTKQGDKEFVGVRGYLNIWSPYTVRGDFSATLLSLSVSYHGEVTSISAGWMVNPQEFHDQHPRIFAFYTNDNYTTACYNFNAHCSGFVVASRRTVLSAPITQTSTYQENQFAIDVKITQDDTTKNWWLTVDEENVGYWPSRLVPELNNGASNVGWGGQVYASATSTYPSSMGSGWRPETGYKSASFIAKVEYVNKHYQVIEGTNLLPIVTHSGLYNVSQIGIPYHTLFFYGGPRLPRYVYAK